MPETRGTRIIHSDVSRESFLGREKWDTHANISNADTNAIINNNHEDLREK